MNKEAIFIGVIGVVGVVGELITLLIWRFWEDIIRFFTRPKLIIGEPFRDHRPWAPRLPNQLPYVNTAGTATDDYIYYMRQQQQITEGDIDVRYYVHLPIRNDTVFRGEHRTAKKVNAKLYFYSLDKEPIGNGFDARWESSNQPSLVDNKNKLKVIDIPAGKTENLDIASRRVTGNEWYVMNNDSYDNPRNSEIPSGKIGSKGFIVHVILDGENLWQRKRVVYKVIDTGGSEPEFIKLKKVP